MRLNGNCLDFDILDSVVDIDTIYGRLTNSEQLYVEEALTGLDEDDVRRMFDDMIEELGYETRLELHDDEVALNELFNNWTDGLCKDNVIGQQQYNTYTRD